MTIDKMIEVIRKLFNMQNIDTLTLEEMEALSMAIKALKQYGALQEIRQEINEYGSIMVEYSPNKDVDAVVEDVLKQAKRSVLAIIDKHIKEYEDE